MTKKPVFWSFGICGVSLLFAAIFGSMLGMESKGVTISALIFILGAIICLVSFIYFVLLHILSIPLLFRYRRDLMDEKKNIEARVVDFDNLKDKLHELDKDA